VIPDVIESKSNFIEHPELIAQRIGRYANLVGRENVIAGSDCGYGTWGRPGRGRSGRGVGQVRRHGRGCAHRDKAILEVGFDDSGETVALGEHQDTAPSSTTTATAV
jgi:hypothetical protein